MYTLSKETAYTHEIKKSKFITHIIPYSGFSLRLEELRVIHPKARHFVTATRHYNEHHQLVESFSDDGEPKGTAGKPSLHVLQGHDLVEVGAVTIRYFGGIKLGTGGLVRAYSDAINFALKEACLIPYFKEESIRFSVSYSDVRMVEYVLEQIKIDKVHKEFGSSVLFHIEAPRELLSSLRSSLDGIAHIPHWQEDTKSE